MNHADPAWKWGTTNGKKGPWGPLLLKGGKWKFLKKSWSVDLGCCCVDGWDGVAIHSLSMTFSFYVHVPLHMLHHSLAGECRLVLPCHF